MCSPPALGDPCPSGGLTRQGNTEPLPGLGISNPVHLASGNKYQLEVDLPPNPQAPGLELVRHYNGLARLTGALGSNWSFSYDVQLQRRGSRWYAQQSDGSVQIADHVSRQGKGFLWRWRNGRELRFDSRGRLIRIRDGGRKWVDIHRHEATHPLAGKIHRIQTPDGKELLFEYADVHGQTVVAAVQTPLGRFQYRYEVPPADSGHRTLRLVAVLRPDGMGRIYHYEPTAQSGNPYALTGISLMAHGRPARRLTSWEYDRYSRVTRIHHHGRALSSLDIAYLESGASGRIGHTRVSNRHGNATDIHFLRDADGRYRMLGPDLEYDTAGRLARMGDTALLRTPGGALRGVDVRHTGWPGLHLQYHRPKRQLTWYSASTGSTEQQADASGRPASLRYANGDTLELSYDAQNRPVELVATGGRSKTSHATRLQWRGKSLYRIEHPYERESRRLSESGAVLERSIERPPLFGGPAVRFHEVFHYDAHGHLIRHDLPEGGALVYAWAAGAGSRPRLVKLIWEDAVGRQHVVVDSRRPRPSNPRSSADYAAYPGYRYGNGLELLTLARASPHADALFLSRAGTLLWHQSRRYDDAGRVMRDQHDYPDPVAPFGVTGEDLRFTYDSSSRLKGVRQYYGPVFGGRESLQETGPENNEPSAHAENWWFAWHDDGRLAALKHDGVTDRLQADYDAAGLPRRYGARILHYGPSRRLEQITVGESPGAERVVAEYRHNAFGHRIMKKVGEEIVHFLYWHDRLVAEARSEDADTPPVVTRRYLHVGSTPIGMIDYPRPGSPRLYFVHADLSGAPRMLTDERGDIRWMASYSPLGQAQKTAGDLAFPLRLPGQYEDFETGWHDNLLRTYVPGAGHYLEPDPVGPLPGSDTYGYAAQQPWRYADPSGLLLFAFDGTRYSADTRGNVWKLAQAYGSSAHYHSGPGNSSFLDWDAVVAWRAGRILENQWQSLLTSLELQPRGVTMPIDIVGFSRGAALARHFANRIASHTRDGVFTVQDDIRGQVSACVDLRFMGLFDTVAQFGIGGSHNHLYDFGIDAMWSWVSHAVALHEHRWTFPLTSARQGDAGNVVEAPFVGAHADIGGGLALYDTDTSGAPSSLSAEPPGDTDGRAPASSGKADADAPAMESAPITTEAKDNELAKIALQWMHWQALAATADFDELDASDATISGAQLRDMRSPLWRTIQRGDRSVAGPEGDPWLAYQSDHPRMGAAQREQVEAFIDRLPDWRSSSGDIVGEVDMDGYAKWLDETLGWTPNQG